MPPTTPGHVPPEQFAAVIAALDNRHRLRIIARLLDGRIYVSELARRLDMSRPLLYMHLEKLESAGLVASTMEISDEGKATRFYEACPFVLNVTPESIAQSLEAS